jgi:hypothetical protein
MAGRHRAIADYRGMVPIYCFRIKCTNIDPSNTEIEKALQHAYSTIETEDLKRKQEADLNGDGYINLPRRVSGVEPRRKSKIYFCPCGARLCATPKERDMKFC